MTIRLKLTLWYSVVLAATLIAFGVAIYFFVNYNAYSDMRGRINNQTAKLVKNINFNGMDLGVNGGALIDNQLYIQLINYTNGDQIAAQSANLSTISMKLPFPRSEEMQGMVGYYDDIDVSGNPFLVYQQPLYSTGNTLVGLLQVAAYSGREEALLSNLRTILVFSSIVALLIAFTVGLFLARQALR
ncbi:cell wall metabolism sensor histidine kinase WalK, partial [Paenibacillus sepulcri]|nr:cell wall metabolism sensor histidine kinase WalK [Paenibacillus sepulcri]